MVTGVPWYGYLTNLFNSSLTVKCLIINVYYYKKWNNKYRNAYETLWAFLELVIDMGYSFENFNKNVEIILETFYFSVYSIPQSYMYYLLRFNYLLGFDVKCYRYIVK